MRLAAETGQLAYVSDTIDDDLPYWMRVGERDQLVIPYTMDANDMRFATAQGFNTGEHFFTYLKDTFDVLMAEGAAGSPKMPLHGLSRRLRADHSNASAPSRTAGAPAPSPRGNRHLE